MIRSLEMNHRVKRDWIAHQACERQQNKADSHKTRPLIALHRSADAETVLNLETGSALVNSSTRQLVRTILHKVFELVDLFE